MRFPGFTEPWQKCFISQFGDIITGNTPSTSQPENYIDEGYLWASPSDLNVTKYVYGTKTRLSEIGFQKTRIIPKHSILVTCIGSTIGKMGMASTVMSTNQQINTIVANSSFDKDFVYYAIQSRFPKYLSSIAVQAVPILSKSTFGELENYYPSIIEQKRIGELLSLLDERIDTQRRLIEDLEKLRYAIRNKLFQSIQGKNLPLENVADIIKGKQLNSEFLMKSGSYYVMNGGIEPSGYYHTFNVSSNTISISEGGNSCGYVQWNNTPFWSGGHCYTLNIKDRSIEDKYLYHFLKWREADIMKLRIGTGLPNIQKKDLARVTIEIPTSSLQTKIICLLDFYNAKIENETYVLELYNRQKLYLLSQMFI